MQWVTLGWMLTDLGEKGLLIVIYDTTRATDKIGISTD